MNLAIVSPYPPHLTGIGQYGFHVSQALAQSGQFRRIDVLAGARSDIRPVETMAPINVRHIWRPGRLDSCLAILKNLHSLKPDLVWFNLGASIFGRSPLANMFGYMSLQFVRWLGLPVVVTLHELIELADLTALNAPGGRLAPWGVRWLTGLATQADVICLTMRHYVDWFSSRRPGLTCFHIPIGAYQAPELLPESLVPELLFFTTLAPYKGLEVLLSAYTSLRTRLPDVSLTIAGAEHPRFPGYQTTLRREYAGLPGVRWLGEVPEDRIRSLFAQAQIVVLPYLASTGSSSVLYQAAAWGRTLAVSDLVETRAAVEENGFQVEYFPSRDSAALAGAIQALLESSTRRQTQVRHNFQAIQRRRPEVTCRAYLQAFNLALEARSSHKRIEIPAHFPSELA